MKKLQKFLSGKKSYLVSVVIFVLGGLQALGVEVPQEAYVMLGGLLGVTLRRAVSKN